MQIFKQVKQDKQYRGTAINISPLQTYLFKNNGQKADVFIPINTSGSNKQYKRTQNKWSGKEYSKMLKVIADKSSKHLPC